MLGCDEAPLGPRAALFAAFLRALHAQLEHSLAAPVRCTYMLVCCVH